MKRTLHTIIRGLVSVFPLAYVASGMLLVCYAFLHFPLFWGLTFSTFILGSLFAPMIKEVAAEAQRENVRKKNRERTQLVFHLFQRLSKLSDEEICRKFWECDEELYLRLGQQKRDELIAEMADFVGADVEERLHRSTWANPNRPLKYLSVGDGTMGNILLSISGWSNLPGLYSIAHALQTSEGMIYEHSDRDSVRLCDIGVEIRGLYSPGVLGIEYSTGWTRTSGNTHAEDAAQRLFVPGSSYSLSQIAAINDRPSFLLNAWHIEDDAFRAHLTTLLPLAKECGSKNVCSLLERPAYRMNDGVSDSVMDRAEVGRV